MGRYDDTDYQDQELRRIVARLADQDNRITAEPLFCVQVCELRCGLQDGHGDIVAFVQDGQLMCRDHWELIEKAHDKFCDERYACDNANSMIMIDGEEYDVDPDHDCGLQRTECKIEWVTRAMFFTEQGAQQYLDENLHNLRGHEPPRIYAESLYRCHEMIVIRHALPRLVSMLLPASFEGNAA